MKHNYLNNRDILKEIHKSKNSFCSYLDSSCADYDIILHDAKQINKKNIKQARQNRSERLARIAYEEAAAQGEKRKLEEFIVDYKKIPETDVVIRIMTWEHIPVDMPKTVKVIVEEEPIYSEYDEPVEVPTKYVKVNFPPFQHFKVTDNGDPYCVGKSHWQGDLVSGSFSKTHGTMTNKLAMMFMKLCERYATRSNWRGYTYNDEMRSQALLQLSQIGLQFDESKSLNPFAYYTAAITNSFTRVLNIEKKNQNIRDDILEMNNMNPSYTRQNDWGNGGYYHDE